MPNPGKNRNCLREDPRFFTKVCNFDRHDICFRNQMKHRYFISLEFDGTVYRGWQVQPNALTVQGTLEAALGRLLGEQVPVVGAGRTDTGVHALKFYAHFDTSREPGFIRSFQLVHKLNRILPRDIAVHEVYAVDEAAHARFDAISRTYVYQICLRKDPFMQHRSWLLERKTDIQAMQKAADMLLAYRDFSSFSKSNTQVGTHNCHVMQASWSHSGHLLRFEIRADRFLRNMVRAIVGTLCDVGLGKLDPADFAAIIEARDRRKAGYSAPGCGLFLTDVQYPEGFLREPLSGKSGTETSHAAGNQDPESRP